MRNAHTTLPQNQSSLLPLLPPQTMLIALSHARLQVCGCGLDTVPVPGRAGEAASDAALRAALAGLLLDVRTLAARLGKPLAARLLPLPGRAVGERTAFANPHLLDSKVMRLV